MALDPLTAYLAARHKRLLREARFNRTSNAWLAVAYAGVTVLLFSISDTVLYFVLACVWAVTTATFAAAAYAWHRRVKDLEK